MVSDVESQNTRPRSFFGEFPKLLGISPVEQDSGSGFRKPARQRETNSARGSGNQRAAAGKVEEIAFHDWLPPGGVFQLPPDWYDEYALLRQVGKEPAVARRGKRLRYAAEDMK